jgi:hypothetical protein
MICCQYVANNEEKNPQPYVKQLVTDYKSTSGGNRTHTPERTGF